MGPNSRRRMTNTWNKYILFVWTQMLLMIKGDNWCWNHMFVFISKSWIIDALSFMHVPWRRWFWICYEKDSSSSSRVPCTHYLEASSHLRRNLESYGPFLLFSSSPFVFFSHFPFPQLCFRPCLVFGCFYLDFFAFTY